MSTHPHLFRPVAIAIITLLVATAMGLAHTVVQAQEPINQEGGQPENEQVDATLDEDIADCPVVVLQAVPVDFPIRYDKLPPARCFASTVDAEAAIQDGPNQVLGILYEHTYRGGDYVYIEGPSCAGYGWPDLGYYMDMDNKVSSTDSFCAKFDLFFNTWYSGHGCSGGYGYYPYVGSVCNDQTSSVRYYSQ